MEKFLFGSGSSSWAIYTHRIYEHTTNETYMRRYILKHPWGSIRLHHILRSDDLRALHDHPFNFWTLLLYGGIHGVLTRQNEYNLDCPDTSGPPDGQFSLCPGNTGPPTRVDLPLLDISLRRDILPEMGLLLEWVSKGRLGELARIQ